MAEQGRHEEGIVQMNEGLAGIRATGVEVSRTHYLCFLAEACREAGRLDDGLNALTEALAAADQREERLHEAHMHRLKGELLVGRQTERSGAEQTSLRGASGIDDSKVAEAQRCFQRAIEICAQA
jgi:predicted ATPase